MKMDFLFLLLVICRKENTKDVPSYLRFKCMASSSISWKTFVHFHGALLELWHKEMLESPLQIIVTKLQCQSLCLRAETSGSGLQPWTCFRAQVL